MSSLRFLFGFLWLIEGYLAVGENELDDSTTIPGKSGVDYPVHATPPKSDFRCYDYDYAGYFADVSSGCQAYHVCFPDYRNATFLCANGTVFNQKYFVCDWWFHFNCSHAVSLYDLNLFKRPPLPSLLPTPQYLPNKPLVVRQVDAGVKPVRGARRNINEPIKVNLVNLKEGEVTGPLPKERDKDVTPPKSSRTPNRSLPQQTTTRAPKENRRSPSKTTRSPSKDKALRTTTEPRTNGNFEPTRGITTPGNPITRDQQSRKPPADFRSYNSTKPPKTIKPDDIGYKNSTNNNCRCLCSDGYSYEYLQN